MNKRKPDVLLIEDEPELAGLLKAKLEEESLRVISCDEFNQGAKMASHQKYSCIVLEFKPKNGSGEILISSIRRNSHHVNHSTPILVIGDHLNGDTRKNLGKNINGIMVKPFDRSVFAGTVKNLCVK